MSYANTYQQQPLPPQPRNKYAHLMTPVNIGLAAWWAFSIILLIAGIGVVGHNYAVYNDYSDYYGYYNYCYGDEFSCHQWGLFTAAIVFIVIAIIATILLKRTNVFKGIGQRSIYPAAGGQPTNMGNVEMKDGATVTETQQVQHQYGQQQQQQNAPYPQSYPPGHQPQFQTQQPQYQTQQPYGVQPVVNLPNTPHQTEVV